MATPVAWNGINKLLTAPEGYCTEQVQDLPAFNNGVCSVSCWQLTPEELADIIQNDGKVFISIFCGPSQPPVFVGSEETCRGVVVDYGAVWPKDK